MKKISHDNLIIFLVKTLWMEGYKNLGNLNFFANYFYHLSLIVFTPFTQIVDTGC